MKKEQNLSITPNESNNNISHLPISTPAILTPFFSTNENEIVAGIKVRSKVGMPKEDMIIVGFFSPDALEKFSTPFENLTPALLNRLALKIIKNPKDSNKYAFVMDYNSDKFSASTSYVTGSIDRYIKALEFTSKRFYCLCKYWSNTTNKFCHIPYFPQELDYL